MTDRITSKQRSMNMVAVKSRGNISTELALVKIFHKEGVTGWRRHAKIFNMRPDFVFSKQKLAIFVHGCFWHGCKVHRSLPVTNKKFWKEKISVNKRRDARVNRILKALKWRVLNIWEHDIKRDPSKVIIRIHEAFKSGYNT